MTFGTSSIGFDPADSAQYAAEVAPILGGPPSGQDRYYCVRLLWLLCVFFCRVFSVHSSTRLAKYPESDPLDTNAT